MGVIILVSEILLLSKMVKFPFLTMEIKEVAHTTWGLALIRDGGSPHNTVSGIN